MGILVDFVISILSQKVPAGLSDDDKHQIRFMLLKFETGIKACFAFKATKLHPAHHVLEFLLFLMVGADAEICGGMGALSSRHSTIGCH